MQYSTQKLCPKQTSYYYEGNKRSEVEWPSIDTGATTSHPLCLDNKQKLIKRICEPNGEWSITEPPQCAFIQNTFEPSCPSFHEQFGNRCIFISNYHTWNNNCPNIHHLNITEPNNLRILHALGLTQMWLPVQRYDKFGKLKWANSFIDYYHPLLQNSIDNDCLIISHIYANNLTYIPKLVNCSSKYRYVCIYPLSNVYTVTKSNIHCSTHQLNIDRQFCIFYEDSNENTTKCNKLAEPLTIEENYMVKENIGNRLCRIGLENIYDERIKWTHLGYPSYTDWTIFTNFTKTYTGISKAGWSLHDSDKLHCRVCEVNLNLNRTRLILQLFRNETTTGLLLTVYMPFNIIDFACKTTGFDNINLLYEKQVIFNSSVNEDRAIYLIKPFNQHYNYYWCEAKLFSTENIIRTKKMLFGLKNLGREYAFVIIIERICAHQICDLNVPNFYKQVETKLRKILRNEIINIVRSIKILDIIRQSGDIKLLYHVRTHSNKLSVVAEFILVTKILHEKLHDTDQELYNNDYRIKVVTVRGCDGCLPVKTNINGTKLHWPHTEIGERILPEEICYNSDLMPVFRTCTGDYMSGADWSPFTGICHKHINLSHTTNILYNIYNNISNDHISDIMKHMVYLTGDRDGLLPVDIYYISRTLKNISQSQSEAASFSIESNISESLLQLISNLINAKNSTLALSNRLLNSTNELLDATEKILNKITPSAYGLHRTVTASMIHQVSNPSISNVSGIALLKPESSNPTSFNDYIIRGITASTTFTELLLLKNLEMAVYIPQDVLASKPANTNVSISLFYNSSIFVEGEKEKSSVVSSVLSVSIDYYEGYLRHPISVILKPIQNENISGEWACAYWDFGYNVDRSNYSSQWNTDGIMKNYNKNEAVRVCEFTHLTHFALLVTNEHFESNKLYESNDTYSISDKVLDILTAVGCMLSIFGITLIILTGILFKSWRHKVGNKILLNICASIFLQIVALYVADIGNIQKDYTKCIITGAILHYSILSSFAWTLITAILQYMRFVLVLNSTPPHLLLKSSIIGWIIPSLPVILALCINKSTYVSTNPQSKLCYPQGILLYITVLLPILVVVITNLIIFGLIIHNISSNSLTLTRFNVDERKALFQQLKLGSLLFSLFGLSWLFGLIASIYKLLFCLYIFCITATLQGFILFVYFVVLDTNTRRLWTSLIKINKYQERKNENTVKNETLDSSLHEYDEVKTYQHENMMKRFYTTTEHN